MRKIKPKNPIKKKKIYKALQKEMASRMNMFSRIPEKCDICQALFDKKNREMVNTWRVTVFEETQTVRLTCPSCWDTITKVVENHTGDSKDELNETNQDS